MVGYGSYSDLNVHVKRDCICLLDGNGKTLKEVIDYYYYYYYCRQDLPQAALPVLFLLTADFWDFRPRRGVTLHRSR